MTRTGSKMRSVCAALATCCAWGIVILAGQPLAAPLAQAQSATSTTTLHGGVQQSTTTGDVFNGGNSAPTNTNQPGVGGSPACHQIDPECGGTNRQCYNQAYNSTGIVMSVAQSQSLYQQTRGEIWIRCGVCAAKVICWPRPGFEDLIAGRAGNTGSASGQPAGQGGLPGSHSGAPGGAARAPIPGPAGGINYTSGPDPCRPHGPGGYDYCANGPGARLPPGCSCGSANGGRPEPGLAGYVDSQGKMPAGDSSPEGIQLSGPGGQDPGAPGSSPSSVKQPWEKAINNALEAEFQRQLPEYYKKTGASQVPIKTTIHYIVKKDYVPSEKGYVPYYRIRITQQQTEHTPGGAYGTWNLTQPALFHLKEDFATAMTAAVMGLETGHQDALAFPYGLDAPNNEVLKDATFTTVNGLGYHLYRP